MARQARTHWRAMALACVLGAGMAATGRADLIAYWALDGDTTNQVAGGPTLQLSGGAAFSTAQTAPGNGGSHSLYVDGNDDFAFVDAANGLATLRTAMSGAFTVSMWGRSDVPSSSVNSSNLAYFYDIGSSHGTGTGVFFNQSHGVTANDQIGAYYNSNTGISSGIQGQADTWYHVALAGDGTNVELYVGGTSVGTMAQGGTISALQPFRIGSEAKATSREWKGTLDDVAVWDRKLTPTQIARLSAGDSPTEVASGGILMVVGSVSGGLPTAADDLAVYNRLTATLGHSVAAIDDSASTAADAAGRDLVVVSGSVSSGEVGNKFNYIGVPVLNYEGSNWNDFKLSADGAGGAATDLDILLPNHPLAAGLSAGVHTVVTASSQFSGGDAATLGAGAQVVANVVGLGRPGIVDYTTGALLSDQGSAQALPAPATRIGYFLRGVDGGTGAQSRLNADGLALFDAAVAYALRDDPTLRVDFGTGTQQVVPGFQPFARGTGGSASAGSSQTETFSTSIGLAGTVDVTVATTTSLGFRDRGDGNQGALGDLYEDHVKPNSATAGSAEELILTLEDLLPGCYRITTFHNDLTTNTGDIDILLDDARGAGRVVALALEQSLGNPGTLAFATFNFTADGSNPVRITLRELPGTASNPEAVLNGFIVTQIPEPGSIALLGLGLLGLLRRRRR